MLVNCTICRAFFFRYARKHYDMVASRKYGLIDFDSGLHLASISCVILFLQEVTHVALSL